MLEVLVVDSNSSDSTQEIVKDLIHHNCGSEFKMRLIYQKLRMGKASAINFALQHSEGEICIISDADTTFEKNSVTKLVENFADPLVGAVSGKLVIINDDQSSISKLEKKYRNILDILRVGESNMDSTPIFNGQLMGFRRNLFQELGEETIADDTEIGIKIRKKGMKALYAPDAIVYEYTPIAFNSRMKQKVRRGQGIIQSFVKNKDILFNSKYGIYGFVIFPCEFFMHLVSPILVLIILFLSLVSLSISPNIILYFGLMAVLLLVLSGLLKVIQKFVLKSRRAIMDPVDVLGTFLNHQVCLLSGLTLFLLGKNNSKWEKIDEVRKQRKPQE